MFTVTSTYQSPGNEPVDVKELSKGTALDAAAAVLSALAAAERASEASAVPFDVKLLAIRIELAD